MAVLHTGQEGQGREKEEKSGSKDLEITMNKWELLHLGRSWEQGKHCTITQSSKHPSEGMGGDHTTMIECIIHMSMAGR